MCVNSNQSTEFCFSFSKGKPGQNLGDKPELEHLAMKPDLYKVTTFP